MEEAYNSHYVECPKCGEDAGIDTCEDRDNIEYDAKCDKCDYKFTYIMEVQTSYTSYPSVEDKGK